MVVEYEKEIEVELYSPSESVFRIMTFGLEFRGVWENPLVLRIELDMLGLLMTVIGGSRW